MSFFSRRRQPSQTPAVTAPPPQTPQPPQQPREAPPPSTNQYVQQQQQQQPSGSRDLDLRPPPPVSTQSAAPPSTSSQGGTPPTRPSYPWSARRLQLAPPLHLPRPGTTPSTAPSPSPFPRYGHSLPPICTASGDIFIFGGLVKDNIRNDLYSFSTSNIATSLVDTFGEIPPPRVGHASALVSSVLIVWGGDTKTNESDRQDDSLYLLNLGTREWTRVVAQGAAPAGRYGHAVTMCGTRFYVYGGQVDGEFLDDLWSFDLSSLKKGVPRWENLTTPPNTKAPARRTGHVMVTSGDKLYLFGGTDGQYHYNDTWCYDTATGQWNDLECIGFIPLPREGHAAALVDDVMYIFGGRGVDGNDLSDLAAFKISNQRWYMFQNMGPGPSGRSGHAMASAGTRVFVLGGESSTVTKPDDPGIVHILETKNIKYPDSSARPQSSAAPQGGRRPSQSGPPPLTSSNPPQQSPPSNLTHGQSAGSRSGPIASRAMSPQQRVAEDEAQRNMAASPPGSRIINGQPMQAFPSPSTSGPSSGTRVKSPVSTSSTPTRPRRDDDESEITDRDREDDDVPELGLREGARSREGSEQPHQISSASSSSVRARSVRSPTPTNSATRATSPIPAGPVSTLSSRGLSARSPSPSVATPPPSDAFHYTSRSSPHANGRTGSATGHAPSSSLGGQADILRDLRGKETELETLKRREAWMKAALANASKQGFVVANAELPDPSRESFGTDEDVDPRQLAEMIMTLKKEHVHMQNDVAAQARVLSERFAEADRVKNSALQEAAFYRAKLAGYESGVSGDVNRLDRERAANLERQLANSLVERQSRERRLAELSEALAAQERLREHAEEQALLATKRAEEAEASYADIAKDHAELHDKHTDTEVSLREYATRVASLTSLADQREVDHANAQNQLDSLTSSHDQHVRTLQQLQAALAIASSRADEADSQWRQSRERIAQLEADQLELRNELEIRVHEAESATARLAEAENAWAKSREEADAFRALTTGSLGQLLDSHKELRTDEDRDLQGHQKKVAVLENEVGSLRQLLSEFEERAGATRAELADHRSRSRAFVSDNTALKSRLASVQSQLIDTIATSDRTRKELADREAEVLDSSRIAAEAELRLGALRNYLAESGITVDMDDLMARSGESEAAAISSARIRELESKLREKSRQHEEADRLRLAAEAKAEQAITASTSSRGGTPLVEAITRADTAERQLAEAERSHKERLQQMEADYQTAVHYVNRTEKMMRRVKEEHTRQKTINATLQAELDASRPNSEMSSRSRLVNGQLTPMSDEGHDSLRLQLVDAQRAAQRSSAENADLQKKMGGLQSDFDRLRESLSMTKREADLRLHQIEDLESEIERLEASLEVTRQGRGESLAEDLTNENLMLKAENELLQRRIGMLLDVDTAGPDGDRPLSGRPGSYSSSDHVMASDSHHDMDAWRGPSSHRPLSEYDSDPPHAALSQRQRT